MAIQALFYLCYLISLSIYVVENKQDLKDIKDDYDSGNNQIFLIIALIFNNVLILYEIMQMILNGIEY